MHAFAGSAPAPRRQRGFNLLEVMISLAVLSLGLGGIAALLLQGMSAANTASLNSIAVAHAQTGAEMMRANLEAYTNGWFEGGNTAGTGAPGACDAGAQAQACADFNAWRAQVAATLPGGIGFICTDDTPDDGDVNDPACAAANGAVSQNVVKIFWIDANDTNDGDDDGSCVRPDGDAGAICYNRFVTTVYP
jgi:type IV pilus assembly protein PilV